jgi:hypothetical protein
MEWFRSGDRRVVIRFRDYVKDLEGTMKKVYRECLEREVAPHVPTRHSPRERGNYTHDRSLEELGINKEELSKNLASYREWCGV